MQVHHKIFKVVWGERGVCELRPEISESGDISLSVFLIYFEVEIIPL
jgi:hypothetical protein